VVVEAIESLEPRDEIQRRRMVETAVVVAAAVECESAGQDEQLPVQFAVSVPCWPENINS
jgi:hypothetical protein